MSEATQAHPATDPAAPGREAEEAAGIGVFASMATTTHWEPNTSASSPIRSGRSRAAELIETLSAPASRTACASAADRMPPPITNGMNTLSAVRRASSTIVSRRSCEAVMSRKTTSSAPSLS
jgi:hypothetical protein